MFSGVSKLFQLYCRWLDADNYSNFTRKWYSSKLPFPLTIFLPHMKHRSVQSKLNNECTPDLTPEAFHNLVSKIAQLGQQGQAYTVYI